MTQPPQFNPTQLRHAQELERVTVRFTLGLEQSLHLRAKLLLCTCLGCYELADFLTDEISRGLLASDASAPALARAEQSIERDRTAIRLGLATHYWMAGIIGRCLSRSHFDQWSQLAQEIIPAIEDTSGPLAEFRQRVEELAASHLAVLDVDQHG